MQCREKREGTGVRCEMLKPSFAAQSLSIKAHKNICLSFLNVSQPGFSNELKRRRYLHLSKIQLDCTPKPVQLLSKSDSKQIVNTDSKQITWVHATDKEENT